MTSAPYGRGTKFQVDLGSGYVDIPECKDITPPTPNPTTEDATSQDTAGALQDEVRVQMAYNPATCDIMYIPTNTVHRTLMADTNSATEVQRSYRILLAGGAQSIDFDGVATLSRELPHSGLYKGSLSVAVKSVPTENYAP